METPKFSIPKLAPLCSDRKEDLLNDAQFIDEMGKLLLKSTTLNRIGCFVQHIHQQYSQARQEIDNRISLSLKENKSDVDQIEGPNNGSVTKNHDEEVENHEENSASLHENAIDFFDEQCTYKQSIGKKKLWINEIRY